ncbi:MAG TPA: MFS transporter [Candidatus Nanoarchaeia archaeon]|nr:MFS transporter [Candidatus Nanoarchaeia archaeon]
MVTKKQAKEIELRHGARRQSIKEGIFASAQGAFGHQFISPFAIAINSSNSLVALYGAIGGLLGPLSQMRGSRLIEKHSRKKIVLRGVLWEALLWIPFVLVGILFYKGIALNILPLLLIIAYSLQVVMANIASPAWFSWIGDIVDEEYRGRWFSKRNLIHGFIAMILALISSFFLDFFKKMGWIMFGFVILFSLALIFRMISWQLFKGQYEPKIKLKKGYYFSFWEFIKKAPETNFGRFTIFRSLLSFAAAIASPLIAVYLLRNLQFDYVTYMIITLAGSVFALIVIGLWGKIADKYGNYKVLMLNSFLIPAIPILWILSPNPIYLVVVPSIIGGVAWAGFNLSAGNFIYDNVTQEKRGLGLSYCNMLIGIGTFLGAGLGALLIKYIQTSLIEPLIIIFIISAVLRMLAVLISIRKIKEIRKTKRFNGTRSLKNIIIKEAKPTFIEEAHQLMSIKKYIFEK